MELHRTFSSILSKADPERVAFVFQDENGEKTQKTYGEVLADIAAFSVPGESSCGVFCDGSYESIIAVFALAKAHKRFALLSPELPPQLLQAQIQAARVAALVGKNPIRGAPLFLVKDDPGAMPGILFFTSGTTESSKAVVLSESSLCAAAYNGGSVLTLHPDDRLLCCLPLSHVFGFVCSLLWPLQCEASVLLSRGVRHLFEDFAYFAPTAVSLVPQMAMFFHAKKLWNPELKLVLVGAGPLSGEIIASMQQDGLRVSYGYGLTETSSGVALSLGDDPSRMSICPLDEVKIAEDGEILIKSELTMMQGYFLDPGKTASVLEDGYLHTGDLGEKEGDILILKGRKKDTLVLNDGTKIYLPEYEAELSRLFPGRDFAVYLDQEERLTLAFGKCAPRNEDQALVDRFNETLSRSHRIQRIAYSPNALPRTQTGKLQRYRLKEMNL